MKKVTLTIDDKTVQAEEGTTILKAAADNGIFIPTLCRSPELEPYGACRLCLVEISRNDRTRLVASCVYTVQEELVVRTDTEEIRKIRKMILELLYPAVHNQVLLKEYAIKKPRFTSGQTDCSLCGLCVRYCAEITGKHIAYFQGRGIDRKIALLPDSEMECIYCGKCHTSCAGGWIVSHEEAWK